MSDESTTETPGLDWRRETALLTGSLLVGLVVLPLAIWSVGQSLIGPYEGGEGPLALAEALWVDAISLEPSAWLLALAPYALAQLARVLWRAVRGTG